MYDNIIINGKSSNILEFVYNLKNNIIISAMRVSKWVYCLQSILGSLTLLNGSQCW